MENKEIYVQVIKCSNHNFWYNNKIGNVYQVWGKLDNQWYEKSQNFFIVKRENSTQLRINDNDCIVVTRRLKILKLKNKLNENS